MLLLYTAPLPGKTATEGSLAVRELLKKIGEDYTVSPLTVQKTASGRPFLCAEAEADISFAHTGTLALCALLEKEQSHWKIGLDAEPYPPIRVRDVLAFSKRFFAPLEEKTVKNSVDPSLTFTEIFTRKEAFAKYCGEGLGKCTTGADTLSPTFLQERGVRFHTERVHGHIITLCLPRDCEVPLVTKHFFHL